MIATVLAVTLLALQAPWLPPQASAQRDFAPTLERVSLEYFAPKTHSRTTLTVRDGLPTNSVTALCYDAGGFLLVGTRGGLARYDGMTFEPFLAEDTPGLDGDRINTLHTDRAGNTWIGANNAAPSLYSNGTFRLLCDRSVVESVRQILPASDGSFWLVGNVLARFADERVHVVPFDANLPGSRPHSVVEDQSGKIWVASEGGVFAGDANGLELVDRRAARWVIVDFCGMPWCLAADGILFQPLGDSRSSIDLGASPSLWDQFELEDGRRLLATNIGVLSIEPEFPDRTGLRVQVVEGAKASSLPSDTVACFLQAGRDDLWLGTNLNGLAHLERFYSKLADLPRSYPDGPTSAVHQVAGHQVIVSGSFHDELFLLDSECRADRVHVHDPEARAAKGAASNAHGTWVTTSEGLARLKGQRLIPDDTWTDPCEDIITHPDGSIWARIAGGFRPVISPEGNPISREASDRYQLSRGAARAICLYRDSIVVGGNEELLMLDQDHRRWVKLADLRDVKIRDLRAGAEGELWISTYGQGLLRLKEDGALDRWSREAGLPDRFLAWIGPLDSDGQLWLNSNSGVVRVDVASLDAFLDGSVSSIEAVTFRSPEANGASGAELDNGLFVLPTLEGVALFDRSHVPLVTEPPRVSFRPPLVDGIPIAQDSAIFGEANVIFGFTAPIFPTGRDALFQYRLSGLGQEWQHAGAARSAIFPALGPGTYALEVRAKTPTSPWSLPATSDPLVVGRRWYQRPWVWALIAIGAALKILFFTRLQTNYLKKKNAELSQEVHQRLEAESRLKSSEARFRQLFHTAPSALVSWSPAGELLDRNDRANTLFGWQHDAELSIQPWTLFANVKLGRGLFNRALRNREDLSFIAEAKPMQGPARRCRWQFAHSYDSSGALCSIIALIADLSKQDEDARALNQLRSSLARAEEAERSRIARELHDDLSQRLAALALEAHIVDESLAKEGRSTLIPFRSALENITSDVHSLSRQLHPTIVDDLGLLAALRSECTRRNELRNVPIRLTVHGDPEEPPRDMALALFRIAQEALSNATRHSGASGVQVHLRSDDEAMTLTVEDNGCGIEDDVLAAGGGVGLNSMRERARLEGGDLLLERRQGGGTRITASIPHVSNAV